MGQVSASKNEEITEDDLRTLSDKANDVIAAEEKGRRVRIYSVNAREILRAFFSNDPRTGFVHFPQIDTLPTGFKVFGAQLNWQTNCLDVMVEHESFNLVPDGEVPPSATDMSTVWKLYESAEFKPTTQHDAAVS